MHYFSRHFRLFDRTVQSRMVGGSEMSPRIDGNNGTFDFFIIPVYL